FLLSVYSTPFSGVLKISPHGFMLDRELFMQDDSPASFTAAFAGPGGQSPNSPDQPALPQPNAGSAQTSAGAGIQTGSRPLKKSGRSRTANTILIKDLKIGP
ncbi:MAG TPA: hypothetical protein V6C72_08540, partial [Chroococcales cyanobacterium]